MKLPFQYLLTYSSGFLTPCKQRQDKKLNKLKSDKNYILYIIDSMDRINGYTD